jgi:GST-like protein
MIDLYTWPTPNGFKVSIALEEMGLDYKVIPIDIGAGDQFEPDYLKLNPNNKMPTIVDPDPGDGGGPFTVFESGAILIYLAEKTGRFLPDDRRGRSEVVQWVMFQMGSIGPMLGQAHHFRQYAPEPLPYAVERYTNEANRLYAVLDGRLEGRDFLAGDYSIADMATMPWLRRPERQGVEINDYPNVERWRQSILDRPAVERGLQVLADQTRRGPIDEKSREMLFGATQYRRR